jgi:hypothetical protein
MPAQQVASSNPLPQLDKLGVMVQNQYRTSRKALEPGAFCLQKGQPNGYLRAILQASIA